MSCRVRSLVALEIPCLLPKTGYSVSWLFGKVPCVQRRSGGSVDTLTSDYLREFEGLLPWYLEKRGAELTNATCCEAQKAELLSDLLAVLGCVVGYLGELLVIRSDLEESEVEDAGGHEEALADESIAARSPTRCALPFACTAVGAGSRCGRSVAPVTAASAGGVSRSHVHIRGLPLSWGLCGAVAATVPVSATASVAVAVVSLGAFVGGGWGGGCDGGHEGSGGKGVDGRSRSSRVGDSPSCFLFPFEPLELLLLPLLLHLQERVLARQVALVHPR